MPRLINLVKSDIADQGTQVTMFKLTEHAVQEALIKYSQGIKNPKKEQLMKKREVRSYI